MLFTSLEFAIFFALVVAVYCALPARGRGSLLLFASYVFYGWWEVEYLALLWASTALDYTRSASRSAAPARSLAAACWSRRAPTSSTCAARFPTGATSATPST